MTATGKINPAYASKGDLISGPVSKHLVRLAVPMTWGILAIISFQLVDIYFISRLGTQALAALSFTMPVAMVIFSLTLGLTIAMSSVVSRLIGEGDHEKVVRVTTHGLVFAFLTGLVIATIGLLLMNPIFRLMGASDDMLPMIRHYMEIWFAGNVFITMPMIGNAAIRATGDTRFPAMVMTTAAVVNVILDPLLIFGLFGFPRLEMQGAALATVFANACALMAGLYFLHYKKQMIDLAHLKLKNFGDSVKRLLFIALPAGITNTIQPLTNAVIVSILAGFSHESVAAFGVVTRVEAFTMVVIMGLAGGMAPIVGQNWGAARFDRVNETLHTAFRFSILWALGVAAVLGVCAVPIAALFSAEENVIHVAALYFWIVPISYATGNLVQGWAAAFNAMGLPQRSVMMIFGKYLLVQIPGVYLGAHLYGVPGIFIAIALCNFAVGGALHLINWRSCHRRTQQQTT